VPEKEANGNDERKESLSCSEVRGGGKKANWGGKESYQGGIERGGKDDGTHIRVVKTIRRECT